jgi:hypothetical protein
MGAARGILARVLRLPYPVRAALVALVVFGASFLFGCATGQPHMRNALDHLMAAKAELQSARTDKGGHRVRAIELVDEAAAEVQRGIDYARGY